MPENSRFRRGDSFEKSLAYESGDRVWIPACAGITGREGASAFAEFLTYMASLREGSRGEEVTAMGGMAVGDGDGATARIDSSLRSAPFRMTCGGCEGGWVPAAARTTDGSGFPLPSSPGQALCEGDRNGSPPPAFAGAGSRREDNGWGIGRPLGASLLDVGEGMGPRIREDNGWGWVSTYARTTGGSGFPLPSSPGVGPVREVGDGDGSPHSRGQRGRGGFPLPSARGEAGSLWGDGDGSPHTRGQRVGVDSRFRLSGGRLSAGGRGWVPACARTPGLGTGGRAVREPPLRKENIVEHWVHPHPPSSRGQALTFPHHGGRDL